MIVKRDMSPTNLLARVIEGMNIPNTDVVNLGAGGNEGAFVLQLQSLACRRLIHVEIFPPSLEELKAMNWLAPTEFVLDDLFTWTISHVLMHPSVYIMTDVLEHLPRELGEALISHLKRYSYKIVIWLPWGECPQDGYNGNIHQEHLSTWNFDDPIWNDWKIEVFPNFHRQFKPPVSAGWAIWTR